MHDADATAAVEEFRQRLGRFRLCRHSKGEGLQSPSNEERFEGAEGRPQHLVDEPDPVEEVLLRGDDRTSNDVAVAPEILGRAVQHAVHAVINRPLVHRGSEGVVGKGRRPDGPRGGDRLVDVRDHHGRIRRRFDVHQPGARSNRRLPRPGTAGIDEGRLDAEPRQESGEDLGRCGVEARARHDMIATFDAGQDRRGDRAHPRSGREAADAPLEIREGVLEVPYSRIAPAGVVFDRRRGDREIRALPSRRKAPSRAREDRGDDRAGFPPSWTVDGAGPGAPTLAHLTVTAAPLK